MCLNFMTIVQVRLVVQTNDKTEKKYKNTLDCVKKTFSEEGGPIALVFGPSFTTSLLYYSLTSVSNVLTNFFILSYLGFTPRKTPWTFTACKILFKTLELGLTLPLEIIANRMYVQQAYSNNRLEKRKNITPIVPLSPLRYTGLHDSLKRICFEEGLSSTTGIKNKIKQKKHIEPESLIGLKGLYRGFTFRWMSALFSLTYSVLVNKCI